MISIIIVNWNTGLQLSDCISSIVQYHQGLVTSVIVVDNASTDNSLVKAKGLSNLPFTLDYIENIENRGFAYACNQGAALAAGEELLFLNPDTRLFANTLSIAHSFIVSPKNEDVGIVGVQLLDERNQVSRSCARFPTVLKYFAQALGVNRIRRYGELNVHMTSWAHDKTQTVDQVIGAFYLMRKCLFDELRGFDERFFMYCEDLDFSLRARKLNYRSVYLTDAQAFHAGGGASRKIKAKRLFYSLRGRLQYGVKHFSPWQILGLMSVTLLIELLTRTGIALIRGKGDEAVNVLKAYGMLIYNLPAITREKDGSNRNVKK